MALSIEKDISLRHLLEEKHLECALCQDTYKSPKVLDCLHNFCRDCIETHTKPENDTLQCPLCGKVTLLPGGDIENLNNNILLNSILDEAKILHENTVKCNNCCEDKMATMVCSYCSLYMCPDCYAIHQQIKVNRENHNTFHIKNLQDIKNLREFQRNRFEMCNRHNEAKKLYCKVDNTMVCTVCVHSAEHRGHDVLPLHEKVSEIMQQLDERMAKSKIVSTKNDENDKNLHRLLNRFTAIETRSLNKLHKEKEELIAILEQRAKDIEKDIKTNTEIGKYIVTDKIEKNRLTSEACDKKIKEIQSLSMIPISEAVPAAEALLEQFENSVLQMRSEEPEEYECEKLQIFIQADRETFKKVASIGKSIAVGDIVATKDQNSPSGEYIDGKVTKFTTQGVPRVIWNKTGVRNLNTEQLYLAPTK